MGRVETMTGISQSVHESRRIYLQPKTKNTWEEETGKKKKEKRKKENIRTHLANHLSPFPVSLSVSRPRSSFHHGL